MTNIKKLQLKELWENYYKEYVKDQFLTKLEALKMMANELGVYINKVKEEIENIEKV